MRKGLAKTMLAPLKAVGLVVLAFVTLKGTFILVLGAVFGFRIATSDENCVLVSNLMGLIAAASVLVLLLSKYLVRAMDRLIAAIERRRPR